MKKFLAIAMIAATLTSCGGAETKEETTDTTATVAPMETAPVDTAATAPVDTAAKVAVDTTKAAH